MLATLTYRIDPELAGSVTAYPATAEVLEAWQRTEQLMAQREGAAGHLRDSESRRLPYASLKTTLRAVLGDVAIVERPGTKHEGTQPWLVTREPVDPWLLATTLSAWEKTVTGAHSDNLASAVAGSLPVAINLADLLTDMAYGAKTPGWVWTAALWEAMRRIAAKPLDLGYRQLPLRIDSEASLLTWADPIAVEAGDRTHEGLHRIEPRVITLPGEALPLIRLDAHISRMAPYYGGVKHAWVDLMRPGSALLHTDLWKQLPGKAGSRRYPSGLAATLEATSATALPDLPADPSRDEQHRVRLQHVSETGAHRIGAGPGQAFLDVVQRAADERLGQSRRLDLRPTRLAIGSRKHVGPPEPATIADALRGMNKRLRVDVVTADAGGRERVRALLSEQLLGDPATLVAAEGKPVEAGPATLIFHPPAPDLLTEGMPSLPPVADVQTDEIAVALVQTSATLRGKPQDPKGLVRIALAARGIPSQFFDNASRPARGTDHPAVASWRDTLRNAGIIDSSSIPLATNEADGAILVGVFVRHRYRQGHAVALTALVTDTHEGETSWTVLGYRPGPGWLPYAQAIAAHHSGDLVPAAHRGVPAAARAAVVRYVDAALDQLLRAHDGRRAVAFLEAEGCRQLWPGLQNAQLGVGPLPAGASHADRLAVVRLNRTDEVPQPLSSTASTGRRTRPNRLFAGTSPTTWLLCNKSPALLGSMSTARQGNDATRFHVQDGRAPRGHLKDNWHSLTGTEITVIRPGTCGSEELALLTAQLCQLATSWDGRTGLPVPLHLAKQQLDDHPDSAG